MERCTLALIIFTQVGTVTGMTAVMLCGARKHWSAPARLSVPYLSLTTWRNDLAEELAVQLPAMIHLTLMTMIHRTLVAWQRRLCYLVRGSTARR